MKLRIMDGLKLGLPVLCHEASAKDMRILFPKSVCLLIMMRKLLKPHINNFWLLCLLVKLCLIPIFIGFPLIQEHNGCVLYYKI